jgi:hypothetical protein
MNSPDQGFQHSGQADKTSDVQYSVDEVFAEARKVGKFLLLEPPDTPTQEEWEELKN